MCLHWFIAASNLWRALTFSLCSVWMHGDTRIVHSSHVAGSSVEILVILEKKLLNIFISIHFILFIVHSQAQTSQTDNGGGLRGGAAGHERLLTARTDVLDYVAPICGTRCTLCPHYSNIFGTSLFLDSRVLVSDGNHVIWIWWPYPYSANSFYSIWTVTVRVRH